MLRELAQESPGRNNKRADGRGSSGEPRLSAGGGMNAPCRGRLACFLAAPLFVDDGNTVLLADLGDHAMQQDASPAGACAERPAI